MKMDKYIYTLTEEPMSQLAPGEEMGRKNQVREISTGRRLAWREGIGSEMTGELVKRCGFKFKKLNCITLLSKGLLSNLL